VSIDIVRSSNSILPHYGPRMSSLLAQVGLLDLRIFNVFQGKGETRDIEERLLCYAPSKFRGRRGSGPFSAKGRPSARWSRRKAIFETVRIASWSETLASGLLERPLPASRSGFRRAGMRGSRDSGLHGKAADAVAWRGDCLVRYLHNWRRDICTRYAMSLPIAHPHAGNVPLRRSLYPREAVAWSTDSRCGLRRARLFGPAVLQCPLGRRKRRKI
jgi:hypothetical protein